MANENEKKEVKIKKGFLSKIIDKFDKKLEEKSKQKSCCCGSSDDKKGCK
ncbi:MAG: hypothetical protein AABY84_06835 [Candidatus Firestonebacteria bacterium]